MTKTISNKNRTFFVIKISESTKDLFFSAIILFIMFMIIANPSLFSSGTISGLKLFFYSVFPGLFPFMFLTKLLTEIGFVYKFSQKLSPISKKLFGTNGVSLYVFFMSILSGYPIGAQLIGDLKSKNLISDSESKKMSIFCTTSGPIFVIGAVGVGMLNSFKIGLIIYISHILASVLLGIISKFLFDKTTASFTPVHSQKEPNLISGTLSKTINSIMLVGAYITMFYLVSELLFKLNIFSFISSLIYPPSSKLGVSKTQIDGILYGLIEVTRGCKELSSFVNPTTISIVSALISFGGFSIIMQMSAFLKNTQIKTHNFVFSKVVCACLSFLICKTLLVFVSV